MDEWTNKMWYVCIVEYYLALRKESDICYSMNDLEDTILSEISQSQKYKDYMISFINSKLFGGKGVVNHIFWSIKSKLFFLLVSVFGK